VLAAMAMIATGGTAEELAASVALTRRQIAFYASTPAYLPVLTHHGWEDLHHAANEGMRRGDYATLGELVDDDVLNTFAVVGDPAQVAHDLQKRYHAVDQVILSLPFQDGSAALDVLAVTKGCS
jgi:alkanesulfonate monooxygenase SsuD/methylene tetrahydromethanopterin reductase-like flavin-dependent oxidoreductase (luciferase family)